MVRNSVGGKNDLKFDALLFDITNGNEIHLILRHRCQERVIVQVKDDLSNPALFNKVTRQYRARLPIAIRVSGGAEVALNIRPQEVELSETDTFIEESITRLSPWHPDEIYWDSRRSGNRREGNNRTVHLALVERRRVQPIIDQIRLGGGVIAWLEIAGLEHGFPLRLDKQKSLQSAYPLQPSPFFAAASIVGVVVIAFLVNFMNQQVTLGEVMHPQTANAMQSNPKETIEASLYETSYLARLSRIATNSDAIHKLAMLGQIIPNGTDLRSISITDDTLELRAITRHPRRLLEALSQKMNLERAEYSIGSVGNLSTNQQVFLKTRF